MQFIILTVAAMLLGADFAVKKLYQSEFGTSIRVSLIFNVFLGLFTAVMFFVANGFKTDLTLFSIIMAAISALLVISYNVIGFKILESSRRVAIYTIYLMTGGMILPYIYGLLFMNEPFSIMRTIGLFIMVFGVIISNGTTNRKQKSSKILLLCIAVFVLNGGVSIVSKVHQAQATYECISASGFVGLSGMFKAVFAGIILCFVKGNKENFRPTGRVLIITAASALLGGVSYLLQLISAATLPATVMYPFTTGGSIIFSALADLIIFKEELSPRLVQSIALCFVGTLFFI